MYNNPHKILVTGGGGFIGSHLVEKLVNLRYEVRVLDNFSSGREENLGEVIDYVEMNNGDVRDSDVVEKAVKGVDIVVHLAAAIDVQESMEKPLLYHEVNATGTLNLLNSAKNSVKKLIFASSCAVYGDPVDLPIGEGHPVNPLSPYAASKLSAENYCRAFSESYGLKTTIFRLFNVYGPRQSANQYAGVITKFIKQIKRGQVPVIFGDGDQTRDFIFVEDVVDFIVRVVGSKASGIFNVGTGSSVSINRLVELLGMVMDEEYLEPLHAERRTGDILQSRADISEARRVFGFEPEVVLEEGLRRTVDAVR
jgi:UDP-glucose 4-epimerase